LLNCQRHLIYVTYPTRMRQLKILTRTVLILFIINVALAAPVAVQGRPEVRLDANVTKNVTTAPQKRQGPLGEGGSTNVHWPDHAPPLSPDSTHILSQIPYADSAPHTPTPDYVPYHTPPPSPDLTDILSQIPHVDTPPESPEWITGSRMSVGSMPVAGSPYWFSPPSPLPHPSQQGPSDDRFPSGFGYSPPPPPSPYPSQPGPLDGNQLTPPQSPGVDSDVHSLLNPEPFPTDFWDSVLKGKFKRRISGSDSVVNSAQKDTRSQIS
jgi:hypothetical protein